MRTTPRNDDQGCFTAGCVLSGVTYILRWNGPVGAAELRAVRKWRRCGMTDRQEVEFLKFMQHLIDCTRKDGT